MEELSKIHRSWNNLLVWSSFETNVSEPQVVKTITPSRRSKNDRTPTIIRGGDSSAQREIEIVTRKRRISKKHECR